MKKIIFALLIVSSLSLFGAIDIKNGEKVAFLGDSITELGGWTWPFTGFIHLVEDGLKTKGVTISTIRSGKSGHHSRQMLARQKRDVLDKKPQWMFLCTGGNDVAFKISLKEFKKNIAAIVQNARNANIKVILMTAAPRENSVKANVNLLPYNTFVIAYAKENKIPLVDLNKALVEGAKRPEFAALKAPRLSYDGIHLNGFGHIVVAEAILRACGVPEKNLPALKKKWTADSRRALELFVPVTSEQQINIYKAAKAKKMDVQKYLKTIIKK